MKQYIGVKMIQAKPMNRKEYNDYRGWELPSDENGADDGYLVEYLDGGQSNHPNHKGYISWSPADVFEKAYKETTGLTFGLAIEAAKSGRKIARKGWNGQGMFAYIVPSTSFPALTEIAKEHFGESALVPYRAYWALKTAQEDIATWTPSASDTLAEDWVILD
jgi:hypothetical protein